MAAPGALANLDKDAVIEQLSAGRLLKQIAADHGVSKVAIYRQVCDRSDYPAAIQAQAESLVEQATAEVMECDAASVNIARARVDAAHKWAAARDPARWGQKGNAININADGPVTVQVVSFATQLPQIAQEIGNSGDKP